ncbi:pyruvate, phosphate dikinase/phosphoenolpyruvate synthase regulator [Aeoliella mucimassa]|uniref:Pyruvate, phosphate dikinase regulatory protein n=1 Tax=Aeoliella mucimassa TaxID=2527972 RepID=A0A518AM76_9BACT|nr:pyruvate, phosphate dikinase/phosphoenolpyruvate synthase regulator [Aeoliella mucimassa]QDU55827.1 Putative pyruvate, phosphate dikinase regulatory protein [Aeoliella mucimassa]
MTKKKTKATRSSNGDFQGYTIHLIATAAGELLSGLATVAISQFPEIDFEIVPHPLQDTTEKLEETLDHLTGQQPIVLHALADETAKLVVRNRCVVRRIPHFDITGSLFNFIADCVGILPKNDVSHLHRLDSAYQNRIEAMEFALEHDDSLGLHSLEEADLVIVGISRVSKSPTTLYLSSRGYKVANVSIAPETGFPSELDRVSKRKVVAFTMQPKRLHEIRVERASRMRVSGTSYEDLQSVIREVMNAETEYRRRGYLIIDVTRATIEQTAAQIMQAVPLKPK